MKCVETVAHILRKSLESWNGRYRIDEPKTLALTSLSFEKNNCGRSWVCTSIDRISRCIQVQWRKDRRRRHCAAMFGAAIASLSSRFNLAGRVTTLREWEEELRKRYFTRAPWEGCRQFKFCSVREVSGEIVRKAYRRIRCTFRVWEYPRGIYDSAVSVFSRPVGFPCALISRVWRNAARSLAGRYWHARLVAVNRRVTREGIAPFLRMANIFRCAHARCIENTAIRRSNIGKYCLTVVLSTRIGSKIILPAFVSPITRGLFGREIGGAEWCLGGIFGDMFFSLNFNLDLIQVDLLIKCFILLYIIKRLEKTFKSNWLSKT